MNYFFKLTLRALMHYKIFSAINVVGLALSLACVISISHYVYGELTVDHFHTKLDRIYVTTLESPEYPGRKFFSGIFNPNRVPSFIDLREDPAVECSSMFFIYTDDEVSLEQQHFNAAVLVADSSFFKILDFPVVAGVSDLSRPESALITESFARKLFGKEDPIGKVLKHSSGASITITGVIGKTTAKSTLNFDVIISYYLTRWSSLSPNTLVLLAPNHDYREVNEKYASFFAESASVNGYQTKYQLFPLRNVYLNSDITSHALMKGNRSNTYLLFSVGVAILLVGVINFVNIYSAIVLRRRQEMGIKKVYGASGNRLFGQLWLENIILIGLALIIALSLLELFSPLIQNLMGFGQVPFTAFDLSLALSLLLFLPLVTTLIPFIHYHRTATVLSLSKLSTSCKRPATRRTLLCLQNVLTIFILIVSLFFVKQLRFMLHTDTGFRTHNIIEVPFSKQIANMIYNDDDDDDDWEKRQNLERQIWGKIQFAMNASPLFDYWCVGSSPVGERNESLFKIPGGTDQSVCLLGVNESWLNIFDIKPIAGRLFRDTLESFTSYALMATESAIKLFDITDFERVMLEPKRRLWYSTNVPREEMNTNPPYRIVGVVPDVHPGHLGQKGQPVVFLPEGARDGVGSNAPLLAAIAPGHHQDAIAFLQQLHSEVIGGEFTYSFIEDQIKALYAEDQKVASVYSLFTVIAIVISALGLFGMSLFEIRQRNREIALRKVNGAHTFTIFIKLLKNYALLLSIAFAIAAPAAWIAIHRYLEDFSLKAPVSWWLFALSLLATAAISLLTLIWQTLKAANSNPALVLHPE